MVERSSMVQIFFGDNHCATSAALGTVMRSAGYGLKVYVVFFSHGLKQEQTDNRALSKLTGVDSDYYDLDSGGSAFIFERMSSVLTGGQYDLVVLDQILTLVSLGLIDRKTVMELMKSKHLGTELIVTGNAADKGVIAAADLVTKCGCEEPMINRINIDDAG